MDKSRQEMIASILRDGYRPFNPDLGMAPRPNMDGSRSTEYSVTAPMERGGWSVLPSIWWRRQAADAPWQPRDLPFPQWGDEDIARLAAQYEALTGEKFPRFRTPTEADWWARSRSSNGAGLKGPLSR